MTRVLVLGATGRQGGAVARQLIRRGHEVTALVRDGESPNANHLGTIGVRLISGDLRDPDALAAAIAHQDAVFGLSIPFGAGGSAEEVRAGRALVDAASNAHLIYSSVRGGDRPVKSGVQHADAKQAVEAYLKERSTPATILGPVYFMDNALNVGFSGLSRGALSTPLTPSKRLDQVAVVDIAAMAVYAIEHPSDMIGRRVELASDSLSGELAAEVLSRVIGRDIPYEQLSLNVVRQHIGDEFVAMWESFERNVDFLDIPALHTTYPEIEWHSYESWARTIDWDAVLSNDSRR